MATVERLTVHHRHFCFLCHALRWFLQIGQLVLNDGLKQPRYLERKVHGACSLVEQKSIERTPSVATESQLTELRKIEGDIIIGPFSIQEVDKILMNALFLAMVEVIEVEVGIKVLTLK